MRRFILALVLTVFAGVAQAGFTAQGNEIDYEGRAHKFIMHKLGGVLDFLERGKRGDRGVARLNFQKNLVADFDLDTVSKLALGKYWERFDNAQKKEFGYLFTAIIVNTYWNALDTFLKSDYDVQYKGVRCQMVRDSAHCVVRSVIKVPNTPSVNINYFTVVNEDKVVVYDVGVEGFRMVKSYKGTFASMVEKSGVKGLLNELKRKVDQMSSKT